MENVVDLSTEGVQVDTSWDDVVIEKLIRDIPGGRSLNIEDLKDESSVIRAGHIILRDEDDYKALNTKANGEYDDVALADYEVVGVLYRTILKSKPIGSIMTRGVVNEEAVKQSGAPDYADLGTNVNPAEDLILIEFVKH